MVKTEYQNDETTGKERGRFIDRYMKEGKAKGCFLLGALILFVGLSALIVLAGPVFIAVGETGGGIACIVVGLLCGTFFGVIGFVMPYYQWKKGIDPEARRVWKTGVLTAKELESEFGKGLKQNKTGFLVAGIVCIVVGVAMILFAYLFYGLIALGCGVYCIINGVRTKKTLDGADNYYIVEDRVIGNGIDTRFGVIEAVTTHLPDRVPYLILEKYGKYDINIVHFNSYFMAHEIEQDIALGEDVYVVCSGVDNSILHIYRAKHRNLSSELLVRVRR